MYKDKIEIFFNFTNRTPPTPPIPPEDTPDSLHRVSFSAVCSNLSNKCPPMGTAVAPVVPFYLRKGVAGIIVQTKVAEKKISYAWLTKPRQNGKFVKKTK